MAGSAGPTMILDDIALNLDAGNLTSYPGSGTIWYDQGPRRMHHDLVGVSSSTVIDGVRCLAFDVDGAFARRNSAVPYTFPINHTMISWARAMSDATSINWRTLWRTNGVHPLLIQDLTDDIGYFSGGFRTFSTVLSTIQKSERWAMWTISCNAGTSTLYVDDGTISASIPYTASGYTHEAIGNLYTSQNQPWGHVATAQIYDRALSRTEVSWNFQATRSRYGL